MSLVFTVHLEDIEKQGLMVSMGGDEVTPSDRKRADHPDRQRYEVELEDGANTIDLMVTSEDDVERPYQLIVRRVDDNTVGAPVIEGETMVGQTLTINTDGLSDPDVIARNPGWHFEWHRIDDDGDSRPYLRCRGRRGTKLYG